MKFYFSEAIQFIISRVKKCFHDWRYGEMTNYEPTGDEDYDNFRQAYSAISPNQHWTYKLFRFILSSYLKNWKWIIGIILTIVSIITAG